MQDPSLIYTVAAGFTGAWGLGLVTQRLGLSPIVGYIAAGIFIGPYTPGYQGDIHVAQQLAEVGVILLMFGVGLHFHLKELLAVKSVAIPGALGQSLVATLAAVVVFHAFGISWKTGTVIGMAMSVASTVVLMRVLLDADVLQTTQGHIAVGWLIVEDILTVVLLVLIPIMGQGSGTDAKLETVVSVATGLPLLPGMIAAPNTSPIWWVVLVAFLKLGAMVAIILVGGARVVPWVLVQVARLRSRELFTLTILVFSIAIAAASYFLFGASMALGAFLAGMVVAQSPVSHQAAADALPMRDAFAVLFFVSVGMLFDPRFILEHPLMLLAALVIILLIKPLTALAIVALLGHSARTALTVAIGLAQIGEFSFIISDLARTHGIMTATGSNLLVAAAIVSITINPLLFRSLPAIEAWLKARPTLWKLLNSRAEKRITESNRAAIQELSHTREDNKRLAIVVGFGPVGRSVHRLLQEAGLTTVVIDMNMDTITALTLSNQLAIYGDASHESILIQSGIQRASHLVLTLPHSVDRLAIVAMARRLNPTARILVRARYLREREELEQSGATAAVFEEVEAAIALARLVLADTGLHRDAADRKIKDLRMQLITENLTHIRTQRVRSIMVPWSRVRWLSASSPRSTVLAQVAQERFSRWPVMDPVTGQATGYLLTKDLIAHSTAEEWTTLVRPLRTIHPEDTIEMALNRMQTEAASLFAVKDGERLVGLITQEDILEQVVGQMEDEYPHETQVSLSHAVAQGGVILELAARSGVEAIRELVKVLPERVMPTGLNHEAVLNLALKRESEFSTDLGNGVALPHARCPQWNSPVIVLGRSTEGIMFGVETAEPVHLIFLLLTPLEKPEMQLSLLGQVASLCREAAHREELLQAATLADVMRILDMPITRTGGATEMAAAHGER
ncbi:MAG: cation:proton antiporter [Gemmatales bacterium]